MQTNLPANMFRALMICARNSNCLDRKVACAITVNGKIVSISYNSTECVDKCQKFDGKECPAEHAETSAVDIFNMNEMVLEGSGRRIMGENDVLDAWVTYQPCAECTKALEDIGVQTIHFFQQSGADLPPFKGQWVLETAPQLGSSLDVVMKEVREYHEVLGYPKTNTGTEEQFTQAREILLAMQLEVAEVAETIQWKPWRKARKYEREHMLEELGDVLFFVDSLLMNFGCSWGDLAEAMETKLIECHKRIERGYHK